MVAHAEGSAQRVLHSSGGSAAPGEAVDHHQELLVGKASQAFSSEILQLEHFAFAENSEESLGNQVLVPFQEVGPLFLGRP